MSLPRFAAAVVTACLAASSVALAQQPPQAPTGGARLTPPPLVAADAGTIAGLIRDAATDAPVARARVVATGDDPASTRVAITGTDGRYEISVPPGSYTVKVSRTGFAPATYGLSRDVPASPVAVAAGQQVKDIDFNLTAASAIAGRVTDEDGSPFAGAIVSALQSRFQDGQQVLVEIASSTSDDRGEFRIGGVPPGDYYVSAADPAFARVGSGRGALRYAPTFYPGTTSADQAKQITVAAAGDVVRADIRLHIVPPSWVTGQLVAFDKRQLLSGAVIMTPFDGAGVPIVPSDTVKLLPDGRFSFANVPPGHYRIRARGETEANGLTLFGQFAVVIQGQDLANLQITLRPGALMDGTVQFQAKHGTKAPVPETVRIRAPFTDGSGFGDALNGTVQPGGTFSIRGLMDGPHQIVVEGLPDPWVVQSVLMHGYDVTDQVIDAAEGHPLRDVLVTITDEAPLVLGRVQDARSRPAVDAGVLVYPIAPQFWLRTNRRMRATRTDGQGHFSIYGLPPGEYYAIASYDVDEGDLARPKGLEAMRRDATPFSIDGPMARTSLDLRLIVAPATAAAR